MTKGAPTSKPWRVKGTSRKDRSRRSAEKVEEEEVRTEGHATRMVQVACKRLYAQINANFRRGKKQYTRDDKFVQAKLYDIICDEARKLWSQSAVSMVRLNYKHDILANGPRGPAEKGPPRIAIMMTWPWCKLALEVKRVQEKYHYSYQSIRNCFARVSYLVYMGGCHVGLVALFGTKEDMQKADLDLFCTPLGGESVVDIALAKDAMSLFGYGDTKGMNKAQVPWAYQKDLKVNCIMNKFEPTEGFCVRVYHVHPSKSGRFKEKFSDEDRLNKLFAEYAEYEDRQQVLERDDSAFPSGAADDSAKYFSPDDIRKDVDKVDIYLQCGAWDYLKAHEEYKEILKRVEQPAAGDGDIIAGGKRKMPGQNIEFDYLAERLKDRITYTHQEVKPPPPPPETDDLYVAGPSPEAEAPSIEPTASPDEILAAYVANAGKPHQKGSLFEGAPELGTVTSRGTNRSRGSYKYMPPKEDVTMGDKPERYVTPEVTTDDVVVQNTLPGSLKLSGEFTEELADPTSIEFMELASATKGALEKQLSKELGDSFHAVQITGFKKGSVVAEFVVIMTDDADKKTQKNVAKCIKQAAKAGVAGRTIQADSVNVEEPQSLSRPQSVAPSAEEDDPKKKRKWSVALSKKTRKSFAFIEVPEDEPESPPKPQEEQKMPRNQGIWKSLRMKPTKHEAKSDSDESADESPKEDATPVVEQKEPERKMPLNLGKWKSLRMKPNQEEVEPESGESTDDSSPETEIPDKERVRRDTFSDAEKPKELELSFPILLNKPEDKSTSLRTPKYSPVPVKRMASATSDLPLPEAVYLKRYSSSSIMDALAHGEEHVAPIMLNTKGSKKSQQKPPKIKLLEKKKSPSLSFKKSKEGKKKPKPEAQIESTEGALIPPTDEDDYLEFIRKDPVDKKTRTEDDQKAIPPEEDDEGSVFNLPILPPPDQPRNRINMAELVNVLAKKQQLKEEEPRKRSVEFKEPEEQFIEEAPATNSPIAVLQPEERKEVNTTKLKSALAAKKQQLVEDVDKQQVFKRPDFATVANRAMTEFGSSKKKDSVKKDSMKENERKLSKMSLKSSLKRSTKKDAAPEDAADLEAQTATLDLGDSASVQRYELAPYDSAMDTIEHDRDQGLFPVRGNFDSRYGEGTAEVYVDGDWEDHTQPHMEAAPPADMLKNSKPRRVYAASDVSSMIATWSFDPEWGSIDLPPSEFDEEIKPTRPAEIESSMVVPRAETPDDGDEISDRDSVSTDNTEDSRFTVVPFELEPEDKEKMRVKLPGEIVAPVVAKTKKKPGDPADDKGCVIQ
ncbi:uncharacterized protein LOC144887462 isoform X5 [Branchiostoma floridae x Branchiostoma japonicum]